MRTGLFFAAAFAVGTCVSLACAVPVVVIAGVCARIKLALGPSKRIGTRAGREELYEVVLREAGHESKSATIEVRVAGRVYPLTLRYACPDTQDGTYKTTVDLLARIIRVSCTVFSSFVAALIRVSDIRS